MNRNKERGCTKISQIAFDLTLSNTRMPRYLRKSYISLELKYMKCYKTYMGIVKVTDDIHEELRKASKAFDRSLNGQAEHWLKIGLLAEIHPTLCYHDLLELLFLNSDLKIETLIKKAKSP